MDWTRQGYTISTDPGRLDRRAIHENLGFSYWARGIPRDILDRSIDNSLSFGLYEADALVGFARVITDRATFAYLSDVFVIESHQGRGFGKWLIEVIRSHPELRNLRRWMLTTRAAHGLYRQFGFMPLANPEQVMEIFDADVYARGRT